MIRQSSSMELLARLDEHAEDAAEKCVAKANAGRRFYRRRLFKVMCDGREGFTTYPTLPRAIAYKCLEG